MPSESYSRIEPQYVLLRQSADKAIERFPSNQTTLPLNLRLYRAFIFLSECVCGAIEYLTRISLSLS